MKKILLLVGMFLFMSPISAYANTAKLPSGLPLSEVETSIDEIMKNYIGENKDIPGAAISIVKDGEIIFEKGYGFADIKKQKSIDPKQTVFEAASISKVYTWTAMMQLVEQGKVHLQDDIRDYLPDGYLDLAYPDKVSILDLMNHTAGFEDTTEELLTTDPNKVIPLKDYLSDQHEQPTQVFRPGTVTAYSNYGTSLAGYIIERVTGEDFATYMQANILDQLEMNLSSFQTDYSDISTITNNKSKSYVKTKDNFEQVDWSYVNDAPAGSLNTTVHDMAKFMLAYLGTGYDHLFEDKAILDQMHEQTSSFTGNAHGFWERSINDYRILEHSGNAVGYTTLMTFVPEENFGVVLFMNVGEEMSGLRVDLLNALIGEQEKPEKVHVSQNDEKVEGTYRIARGIYTNFLKLLPIIGNSDVTVKQHPSGGITLQTAADPEPILYTETDHLEYVRVDNTIPLMDKAGMDTSKVYFQLDGQGNVKKMTYGIVSDFLPVSLKNRVEVHMIIIIVSVMAFIIYTMVALIQWIIRKRKKTSRANMFPATGLLAFIGLIVTVNIIILFGRFMADPFQKMATLRIHLWLNMLLPISVLVCGYFMFKQWKKKTRMQNIARISLLLISCLFTLFLYYFHLLW
ncbi:serine hydrolase [Pseudogracilibacillus sp. ICA-222130]|uniref:serine hydrolase n=1 Tax=Pseudogracilibacillus sp. ICA-222130 TaxID=3134655 RepID=UPI0030C02A9E